MGNPAATRPSASSDVALPRRLANLEGAAEAAWRKRCGELHELERAAVPAPFEVNLGVAAEPAAENSFRVEEIRCLADVICIPGAAAAAMASTE